MSNHIFLSVTYSFAPPYLGLGVLVSGSTRFGSSFLGRRVTLKSSYKVHSDEVIFENGSESWRPWLFVPFRAQSLASLTCWATPGSACRKLKAPGLESPRTARLSLLGFLQQQRTFEPHAVSQELGRMIDSLPRGVCGPKSVPLEPKLCAGVAKINLIHLSIREIFTIKCSACWLKSGPGDTEPRTTSCSGKVGNIFEEPNDSFGSWRTRRSASS